MIKKELWVSGKAPIGYKKENSKLVVDPINLETVKLIFNKYLEIKSVNQLKQYLENHKVSTRSGKQFSRGNLYSILSNKTYIGLVSHKNNVYNGEHKAIIDKELFEKVQMLLSQNRVKNKCSIYSRHPSLLSGKIYDDKGNYMSPSHTNTRNRRYRYYISQAILQARRHEAGSISKIPAGEIESITKKEIQLFLSNPQKLQIYLETFDLHKQKELLSGLNNIKVDLNSLKGKAYIRAILHKVIIFEDKVELYLIKSQLIKVLESITYNRPCPEELKSEPHDLIIISRDIRISSTSRNGSVLIITDSINEEASIKEELVQAFSKSFYWNDLLISGKCKSATDIQKRENLKSNSYVKKIINLRFLAPDIIEAILNGTQPPDLTLQQLFSIKTLDWSEQRKLLQKLSYRAVETL